MLGFLNNSSDAKPFCCAPMESFLGTLKNEFVHHCRYKTREQAIREITEYIELFYNQQRRQARVEYLSPAVYERQFYVKQIATWRMFRVHYCHRRADYVLSGYGLNCYQLFPDDTGHGVYRQLARLLRLSLEPPLVPLLDKFKCKTLSMSCSVNKLPVTHELLVKYSLDDFTVGPDLRKCLDVLAICYKNQK